MNVLSLFDGISCGQLALQRAGIKVDRYFASEIDKYAMKVTQENFPDTVQLGDVTQWETWDLPKIDLLIGGSPCQGFSFAGKQLNFSDPRSKLFFEYVKVLRMVKPRYFLLENVKMKQEYQDVISSYLGVQPVEINSSLVSAQNRRRLYWTNIPNVTQPEDKGILLKDIVLEKSDKFSSDSVKDYIVPFDKTLQILYKEVQRGKVGYYNSNSQGNRVYTIHGKSVSLCGMSGGIGRTSGLYLFGCITPDRIEKRQNGQRFNEGTKFYTLTAQDKHGIFIDGYIRKLTPLECERLQTVPDNYTSCISDSQRYKCLGNGWTVDVIAHILGNMRYYL